MLSKKEVEHIAGLARIGVGTDEIGKFSKELSAVLDWIEQLKEADIKDVEPTANITGLDNVSREDTALNFLGKDKIVNLFPDKKDNFNKVKSVL